MPVRRTSAWLNAARDSAKLLSLTGIAAMWLLLAPSPVEAQPIFAHIESAESLARNSDFVFLGTIVDFGAAELVDDFGRCPVTIEVSETLKGSHRKRVRVRLPIARTQLKTWKMASHRLLVAESALPKGCRVVDISAKDLAVVTSEITLLRKPEQVLQYMKEAIADAPGVTRIGVFSHMLGLEPFANTPWAKYSGVILSVPIDARLEARAKKFLASANYIQREEAAKALRYFKSKENIARVKPLLDDKVWAYRDYAEDNQGIEVRYYGVREAAYETLHYWGIAAKKPQLLERVERFDRVRYVFLSNEEVASKDLEKLQQFKNLHTLYLSNSRIEEGGLRHIARLKKLKLLDLERAKVNAKELAELRELRPKLEIKR